MKFLFLWISWKFGSFGELFHLLCLWDTGIQMNILLDL